MSERLTNQKALILDYLKSVTCHPTAEQVYEQVQKKLPRLSLGTVYRNLNLLRDKGQIQEIQVASSHYDADLSPHAHYICEGCHTIYDLFNCCYHLKNRNTKVGKINKYQIYLYGKCNKCSKR